MLSIRYPLAVELEGNLTGTEERARRGLSMTYLTLTVGPAVGEDGEGGGGGELRQIRGGDGEIDVLGTRFGFEHNVNKQLFHHMMK